MKRRCIACSYNHFSHVDKFGKSGEVSITYTRKGRAPAVSRHGQRLEIAEIVPQTIAETLGRTASKGPSTDEFGSFASAEVEPIAVKLRRTGALDARNHEADSSYFGTAGE